MPQKENSVKSIVKNDVSRISIIGNGIVRNFKVITDVLDLIKENKLQMLNFEVSETKISVTFNSIVNDKILEKMHKMIFE